MVRKPRGVIALPTEKASILGYRNNHWIIRPDEPFEQYGNANPHHLYFTAPSILEDEVNGEEIKSGSWAIVTVKDDTRIKYLIEVTVAERNQLYTKQDRKFTRDYYSWEKVVVTTNKDLWYKDGISTKWDRTVADIPKIPVSFLEAFVREQGIWEVELEYPVREPFEGFVMDDFSNPIDTNKPKVTSQGAVCVFHLTKRWTDEDLAEAFAEGMNAGRLREELPTPRVRFREWLNKKKKAK